MKFLEQVQDKALFLQKPNYKFAMQFSLQTENCVPGF